MAAGGGSGEPGRMTNSSDLDAARERNLRTWTQYTASFEARDLDGCMAFWHPDGRFAVAYPQEGFHAEVRGTEQLAAVLGGFLASARRLEQRDTELHQTTDADVVIVQFRWLAELNDGSSYENTFISRVTFREGRFYDVLEYYGERAQVELLDKLMSGALAA
jgi:ketosteroid isomerase-like protein